MDLQQQKIAKNNLYVCNGVCLNKIKIIELRVKKSNVIAYINWLLDSAAKQNFTICYFLSIFFYLNKLVSAHTVLRLLE